MLVSYSHFSSIGTIVVANSKNSTEVTVPSCTNLINSLLSFNCDHPVLYHVERTLNSRTFISRPLYYINLIVYCLFDLSFLASGIDGRSHFSYVQSWMNITTVMKLMWIFIYVLCLYQQVELSRLASNAPFKHRMKTRFENYNARNVKDQLKKICENWRY